MFYQTAFVTEPDASLPPPPRDEAARLLRDRLEREDPDFARQRRAARVQLLRRQAAELRRRAAELERLADELGA